ncbi:hypothetical protein ABZX41_43835, partial [Streptomyces sp. NPDC004533]
NTNDAHPGPPGRPRTRRSSDHFEIIGFEKGSDAGTHRVDDILRLLGETGEPELVRTFAARTAKNTNHSQLWGVAIVLKALREAGEMDVYDELAERAATSSTGKTDRISLPKVIQELRAAGKVSLADTLVRRAMDMGEVLPSVATQYGRETDGSRARPWTWSELDFAT